MRRVVVVAGWVRGAWLTAALMVTPALGVGASPSSALAGQYHVYACKTPAGESAPADGWSGSNTGPATIAQDTCGQPRSALIAGLCAETNRTADADSATWTFAAPSGETLAGATLWRAGDGDGGAAVNASYQFWLAGSGETDVFSECVLAFGCPTKGEIGKPLSPENRVAVPLTNLGSHLFVQASCGGIAEYNCPNNAGDPAGYAAVVYVYAADLILEQGVGPTATNVSGELATAPTVSGTTDVAFSASGSRLGRVRGGVHG
jgi:hypothetical protein